MPSKSRDTTRCRILEGNAVPGGMADHVDHGLRIEAGFRSQNQRLDDSDPANLGEHVVDQFHNEPLPNG